MPNEVYRSPRPGCPPESSNTPSENSRPIAAPICAYLLGGPEPIEPRHQRRVQACRDCQGRRRSCRNGAPGRTLAASSTAFVISSTNRLTFEIQTSGRFVIRRYPGIDHRHVGSLVIARVPRYERQPVLNSGRCDDKVRLREGVAGFAPLLDQYPPFKQSPARCVVETWDALCALTNRSAQSASRHQRPTQYQTEFLRPRRGDLDGRGNLILQGLNEFCEFFLETCVDQVTFMGSLLEPTELPHRNLVRGRDAR